MRPPTVAAIAVLVVAAHALGSGESLRQELRNRGSIVLADGKGEVGVAGAVGVFQAVWVRSRMPYAKRPVFLSGLLPLTTLSVTLRVERWIGHADGSWSFKVKLAPPWCHARDPNLPSYRADVPFLMLTAGGHQPGPGGLVDAGSLGMRGRGSGANAVSGSLGGVWEVTVPTPAPWPHGSWNWTVFSDLQSYDPQQGAGLSVSTSACVGRAYTPAVCDMTNDPSIGYEWMTLEPLGGLLHLRGELGLAGLEQVQEEVGY
eukprot:Hpha_TRINITY_DN16903_c2_g2::TRINITY_DN16903_c2_g2_i1::g.53495::m.53495